MRISKSSPRKISNRRAHRPDQRVYRSLRLGRSGRRRGRVVPIVIATLTLLACGGVAWKILHG